MTETGRKTPKLNKTALKTPESQKHRFIKHSKKTVIDFRKKYG